MKILFSFFGILLFITSAYAQPIEMSDAFEKRPICRAAFEYTPELRRLGTALTGRPQRDTGPYNSLSREYSVVIDLLGRRENSALAEWLFEKVRAWEDAIKAARKEGTPPTSTEKRPPRSTNFNEFEELFDSEIAFLKVQAEELAKDANYQKFIDQLEARRKNRKPVRTNLISMLETGMAQIEDGKIKEKTLEGGQINPFEIGRKPFVQQFHLRGLKPLWESLTGYYTILWYFVRWNLNPWYWFHSKKIEMPTLLKLRSAMLKTGALREYVADAVLFKLFAEMIDPGNYSAVNNATRERLVERMTGKISPKEFKRARTDQAFVWVGIPSRIIETKKDKYVEQEEIFVFAEVESIIEKTIDDLRRLSGTESGSIASKKWELASNREQIEQDKKTIQLKTQEAKQEKDKIKKKQLWSDIEVLRIALQVRQKKLNRLSRELVDSYHDFAKAYEKIELFQNMPIGQIEDEKFVPIAISDVFLLPSASVDQWKSLYFEALNESSHALFQEELVQGLMPFLGYNRPEIQRLKQIAGSRKVADTRIGRELSQLRYGIFRAYLNSSIGMVVRLLQVGALGGALAYTPATVRALTMYVLDTIGIHDEVDKNDPKPGNPTEPKGSDGSSTPK